MKAANSNPPTEVVKSNGRTFVSLGITPPRSERTRTRPAAAPVPPTSAVIDADRADILLVDDVPEKLIALEAALSTVPVNVFRANSGREALKLLLKHEFAVILLDVNMPTMDGFETATLIRQRPANAHTPIIFVTAFSTSEAEMYRGYSLGAVDYLFTPVTPEVLRSKVSVFVELTRRNREIRRQAEALRRADEDRMQRQLADAAQRIEWETRRNHFFRLSIELLAITDYAGVFTQVNPTWDRTLGYAEQQLHGVALIDFIHPEDRAEMLGTIARIQQADTPLYIENRFRAANGDYRWLGWTIAPFAAEGLLYIFARDMTERRAQEDKIRQLNSDLNRHSQTLQAMNQELEAFSYSLAHDLRTPIRAITTYSEVLLTDEAEALRPEALQLVQRMNRNSSRMMQLMDDFLAFFRLSRQEVQPGPVNMQALAMEAIAATRPESCERLLDVQVHELPTVPGDPAMLRQVFVNLLSNAFKFTGRTDPTHIEIGYDHQRSPGAYYVKDNGVGFDMKYHSKLFGVFERLHPREEFDGTGIGLAIVHKIITRHGGTIWADAAVGQGATFYFTLPR